MRTHRVGWSRNRLRRNGGSPVNAILEWSMIGGVMLMSLAGVLLTFLRLPGTWLIVAVGAGYGWLTDWQRISVGWVGLLAGIAILGELVELLASALIARGAGASRQASWGGMIGGIVGMFVFSLPLPIVGTLFERSWDASSEPR